MHLSSHASGLPAILSRNSGVLEKNFTKVNQFITTYGTEPDNCYEFIYNHCDGITEQYIKIAIEGLYRGLVSQVLPSLPSIQAKEALTFSIINLGDFFRRIVKEKNCLARVLEQLETTEEMLLSRSLEERSPDPESTYIVLIAGLFSNLKNIPSLDFESQQAIALTMLLQLSNLQEKIGLIKKTAPYQKIESSTIANFPHDLFPAYLTFSGLFNTCPKTQDVLEKIDNIKKILFKMYGLYGERPDDFLGLSETFLENARKLKNRCQNFLFNSPLLMKELNTFYQHKLMRCFQMQISHVYNRTCLGNDSINNESHWQDALESVISTITKMHENIGSAGKTDLSLVEGFLALKQLLLWEEAPLPPAIASAQQCMIALNCLFKESPEIVQLPPKLLESIIETLKQLQVLLESKLQNSLLESEISNSERMQIPFKPIQTEPASALTATVTSKLSEDYKVQSPLTLSAISNLFSFFSSHGKISTRADELRTIAQQYGLICKNVAGDGNCLFTAVAVYLKHRYPQGYQTWLLPGLADDLRKRMTDYLSDNKNKQKYKDFIADQDIDAYIRDMRKSGTWGDYIPLHALAVILNVTIVIITSDGSQPVVLRNPTANKDNVVCLGYEVPVHYQLLLSKEGQSLPQAVHALIEDTDFMDNYLEKSVSPEIISMSTKSI